jgi:atypical dual specificity phosphatase
MQTEYQGPISYYSELGMKQLRLPTVDHYEPSVENMKDAVKFIKEYKLRNEKVYIHCKAGHGRAASIALCWMMSENPTMSPKDINAMLFNKRKVRSSLYKQPNVQAFHASLQLK